MNKLEVQPIGKIESGNGGYRIVLEPEFRKGLKGLSGFSHVQVLWWMDGCDNPKDRKTLAETKPYAKGPAEIGVFALRSPERPNPIAVSAAGVERVDEEAGTVVLGYIDAFSGSPVLDLKPYTPSLDRVENPSTPGWCRHWPKSFEESAGFDWAAEFNF
ncbi:MAG: SAM-dependent methyltransferase [Kiritimatiellae bacterium]|nr:SAM-dependent methyltransferase [Kiritimatiellia bacterium]